jgi:hypothetical protein
MTFLELPDIFYRGVCLPLPLAETSERSKALKSCSLIFIGVFIFLGDISFLWGDGLFWSLLDYIYLLEFWIGGGVINLNGFLIISLVLTFPIRITSSLR